MFKTQKRNGIMPMAAVSVALLLFACGATRQVVPSPIGLLPLDSYTYTGGEIAKDTVYRIIRSEAMFNAGFKADPASVQRPGFGGQTVVAIIMKAVPATPLIFTKAEVRGDVINVYAQTCTGANCKRSRAVLATLPNVRDARSVEFFINGESKAILNL